MGMAMIVIMLAGCGSMATEDTQLPQQTSGAAPGDARQPEQAAGVEDAQDSDEKEDVEMSITIRDITSTELVSGMKIGWNLGNTLDASGGVGVGSETSWGNPKTTQELIDAILEQGFNVIRVPVTWGPHIGEAPEYQVDGAWMDRVQEVVDYAYDRGAYVILNIHHEDWHFPSEENADTACEKLAALWTQIANRFMEYDERLIFEGMNEPRKVGTSVEWNDGDEEGRRVVNRFVQVFVDTVRATGGNNTYRHLMVQGYAAASHENALRSIVLPEDDKLIVSVHAYAPYDFALNIQGTNVWGHNTKDIEKLMGLLDELFLDKGIPVIIGEFGAMNKSNEEERVEWAEYYISTAKAHGVPCIWWDNGAFDSDGENFGLIDRIHLTFPYPELLKTLVENAQ